MKVIVLAGFLGAGKTSVLLQFARYVTAQAPGQENRIAIIENEIGDIGVDDQTLGSAGDYEVRNLFSGCICCTLLNDLADAISKLASEVAPEFIIIEPSGLANVANVAGQIHGILGIDVHVVAIIDARRWAVLSQALPQLLDDQVATAEVVLVNKVDAVDAETASAVEAAVSQRNRDAKVHLICAKDEIDPAILEEMSAV